MSSHNTFQNPLAGEQGLVYFTPCLTATGF